MCTCACVCLKNRERASIYYCTSFVRGGEEFSWGPTARASLILGLAAVAPLRRGGQMAKKKKIEKTELQGDDTTTGQWGGREKGEGGLGGIREGPDIREPRPGPTNDSSLDDRRRRRRRRRRVNNKRTDAED